MIPINQKAPVTCSKSILIQATQEKIWASLTDIDAWARWQTDITQPQLNGPLLAGSTFDWKTGGVKIHSTLHTVAPYSRFGWTGKTFGMYAIHNWSLSPIEDKVLVEVTESMEGFLASLFKKSFNKNLEAGMEKWLKLLKEVSEK